MILIPKYPEVEGQVRDDISNSTISFREITLYGRKIVITPSETDSDFPFDTKNAFLVAHGLSSRDIKNSNTIVDVNGLKIGAKELVIAAGPCAVESEEQITEIAENVKRLGANMIRGGAFKPRTSPYSFQGLGVEGVKLLGKVSEETSLPTVSEIMDPSAYKAFEDNIDLIQVGSRNAQNFDLLKFLGKINKPVLLKNGMGNTISEWLGSSEYILSGGNGDVVMCYRGTRSFENATRFSMDTGSITALRSLTHLPICADPSHPAGKREYVESLALSAVAAGADMLEIEVHNNPEAALSDADQQLDFEMFGRIMKNARKIAEIVRS